MIECPALGDKGDDGRSNDNGLDQLRDCLKSRLELSVNQVIPPCHRVVRLPILFFLFFPRRMAGSSPMNKTPQLEFLIEKYLIEQGLKCCTYPKLDNNAQPYYLYRNVKQIEWYVHVTIDKKHIFITVEDDIICVDHNGQRSTYNLEDPQCFPNLVDDLWNHNFHQ